MNKDSCHSLEEFRQQLDASRPDYLLIGEDRERHRVDIRFVGPFQGKEVVWNACLLALRNSPCEMFDRKQFIEVTRRDTLDYDLKIGLAVSEIDKATILKAIIMIRKYKRLQIGYHAFGPGSV